GVSHNIIVFLSIHWCFVGFALSSGIDEPWKNINLSIFALGINFLLFSLEIARKIRLPEFERDLVDTYSKIIGYKASALLVIILQSIGLIMLAICLSDLGIYHWSGIIFIFAIVIGMLINFIRKPDENTAEKLMKPCALTLMAALFIIILNV
ncbi:prenyltransferase, partial [Candidatus Magnetomorum sp. HK-1]